MNENFTCFTTKCGHLFLMKNNVERENGRSVKNHYCQKVMPSFFMGDRSVLLIQGCFLGRAKYNIFFIF